MSATRLEKLIALLIQVKADELCMPYNDHYTDDYKLRVNEAIDRIMMEEKEENE